MEVYKRSLESLLESGQRHIDLLETKVRQFESLLEAGQKHIDHLASTSDKAIADFRNLEAEFRKYRAPWLVRAAHKAAKVLDAFRQPQAESGHLSRDPGA